MNISIKNLVSKEDNFFLSGDIIPLGSRVYNDSDPQKYTVISKEINTEGEPHKYFIDPPFNMGHEINTVFSSIGPQKYFLPSNDGTILKFNGESPFNLSIQSDQTSTISFSSEDLADSFSIIGEHGHLIIKDGTSIQITPEPGGVNKFYFKIKNNTGSISIVDSCPTCNSLKFENFISSEKLNSLDQLNSFLTDCGTSFNTKYNIRAEAFELQNELYHYFVSYCCDLSKDISKTYCYITWKINNIECDAEINYNISSPKLTCSEDNLATNKWIQTSESELSLHRRSHFCTGSCSSEDIIPRLLVEPDPPSDSKLLSACASFTTTTQPLPEFFTEYNSKFVELHVAHSEPLYHTASSLVATSEVLESYNDEDLTDRSFYQESENGYFFEKTMPFLKSEDGMAIGEHKIADGDYSSVAYTPEHYSAFSYDDFYYLEPNLDLKDKVLKYHDIVSPGELPVYLEPEGLVKDYSLFDKVFTHLTLTNPNEIIDQAIASINLSYWFSILPKDIYGSNSWWQGLGESFFPKFSLDLDYTNLALNHSVFYNSEGEFQFSPTLNYTSEDSYSLITLDSFSTLFSTLDFKSDLEAIEHYLDNGPFDAHFFFFGFHPTRFIDIPLVFEMDINLDLVSEENKVLLNKDKITKKETLRIYIDLPFLENYSFNRGFGVDKSFGITSPKFALSSGQFYNLDRPFNTE